MVLVYAKIIFFKLKTKDERVNGVTKESLLRTIIIFLLSAIMIFISVTHLGHNNLMVGVSGLFILIAILNKDFTRTPIRSGVKTIVLMLIMGLAPYFINANIYIGFFINFIAVFTMMYMIVYTYNKTIYFPFLFGYTLLLTSNVTGRNLGLRVIGLVVVGIVAVVFQLLFIKVMNRKKQKNKTLINIIEHLITKVELATLGEFSEEKFSDFKNLTAQWSREILEKRNNTTHLKEKENIELDLIAALESIAHISKGFSDKIKLENLHYSNVLGDINILLIELNEFIKGETSREYLKIELDRISKNHNFSNKDYEIESYEVLELISIVDKMTYRLVRLKNKELHEKRSFSFSVLFKESKDSIRESIADFNKDSVRFVFAFRTAALIALCYFFLRFFDYPLAKWSLFTITSVSQIYNDTVKARAKGRFFGTVAGVLIYVPLAMIFKDKEPRIIIIAIAVFFMISFKKYAYSIAMLTILFVGIVTINVQDILSYGADRVIYIAIGIVAVLIGNKIIFPYNLKKESKLLINRYQDVCSDMLRKFFDLHTSRSDVNSIKNNIILAKSIENKIIINNVELDSMLLRKYRSNQRLFLNKMHNILNRVEYIDANPSINVSIKMAKLFNMTKELERVSIDNKEELERIFSKYTSDIKTLEEKVIYMDVYLMVKLNRKSDVIKNEIIATM